MESRIGGAGTSSSTKTIGSALAGLAGVLLGGALERVSRDVLGAWPDPPFMLTLMALGSLVGAALAAAFLPALRAARVSPAEALREG